MNRGDARKMINDCEAGRYLEKIGWPVDYYDTESSARRVAEKAAERESVLESENKMLRELVSHCWVHSGYENCGYKHMTTAQKELYDSILRYGSVREQVQE